ncbi:hypothetical protein O988_04178 [Pseudogymnoascus sp. VKM F-3808]|nr:hypothetical protein O988_04178 [Pseudogymnoascus sp. VKM F-3808]
MAKLLQRWMVTEPYLNVRCSLGDGPHYERSTNSLRFVDIIQKRLHTVNLTSGPDSLTTIQFDIPVGVTADVEGVHPTDKILVGGKNGVYMLERKTGNLELLKGFHETEDSERDARLRSNDGAIDPDGRFWIGIMNDFLVGTPKPEGSLLRINSDLSASTILTSLTVPNGIGWSLNHKILYFTHSTASHVLAFDYIASTGSVTNERVFYYHEGPGDPDGLKIDIEGNLWLAIYGESRVLKISPTGELVGEITYPTSYVTCPVFVGTELWVTTGDDGKSDFAGGVFKVDVGVQGMEIFEFRLDDNGSL